MFLPSNITLKFGDSGDFVSELQRRLAAVRCFPEDQINGFFDGLTVNGVSAFQTRCSLRADGIAGPETLRRLNATLTGTSSSESTGGGTTSQDDAQAQNAADVARTFYMLDNQQAAMSPPSIEQMQRAETNAWGEQHQLAVPLAPALQFGQLPVQEQLVPQMSEQQQIQQQLLREAQMHQQHFAQNHDQVAQTLLQQQQHHQIPPAQQQPPQQLNEAQMMQQGQAAQAAQALPAQQPPQHHTPQSQQAHPAPQHSPQPHTPPVQQHAPQQHAPQLQQAQPEQARGLIGRAMEKVDALVQKLANYFEAKLPPDTLHEVKRLGQVMAQSGVRESAIPGGLDEVRAQPTPTRAPEPMHIPNRG